MEYAVVPDRACPAPEYVAQTPKVLESARSMLDKSLSLSLKVNVATTIVRDGVRAKMNGQIASTALAISEVEATEAEVARAPDYS